MNTNFPHWFKTAPIAGQPPIANIGWRVWNRSGSATVKGRVYIFDMGLTTTSTSETDAVTGELLSAVTNHYWEGGSPSALKNIILPSTAMLRPGIYCVADEAVADNASLRVTVIGEVTLTTVTYTAADGTVSTPWSVLIGANATDIPVLNNATTATNKVIAKTTGSYTVASNAISNVSAWFNGFGFGI